MTYRHIDGGILAERMLTKRPAGDYAEAVAAGESPRENTVLVTEEADLPDPSGGQIQLESGTTYEFDGTLTTANELVANGTVHLRGENYLSDFINYTGSGTALRSSTGTSVIITGLTIIAANGTALDLTGSITDQLIIIESNFLMCDNVGTISGFRVPSIHFCNFENYNDGLTATGTSNKFLIDTCPFRDVDAAGTSLEFDANFETDTLSLQDNYFKDHPAGSTAVRIDPGATFNIDGEVSVLINNNSFQDVAGDAWSGVSSETVGWNFEGNGRIPNSRLNGSYYLPATATTTISTQGVWVKVDGTTEASNEERFTHTDNRLTYTGLRTRKVNIEAHYSAGTPGNANDETLLFAVGKNGTVQADTAMPITTRSNESNQPGSLSSTVALETGDYVELFVQNEDGTGDAELNGLNFNAFE